MNYDKMLKDINDATALRGVIDSVEAELRSVESAIGRNKKEIEARKGLEESLKSLEAKKVEITKTLGEHQAELDKRVAALEKIGVTLPIEQKPAGTIIHR